MEMCRGLFPLLRIMSQCTNTIRTCLSLFRFMAFKSCLILSWSILCNFILFYMPTCINLYSVSILFNSIPYPVLYYFICYAFQSLFYSHLSYPILYPVLYSFLSYLFSYNLLLTVFSLILYPILHLSCVVSFLLYLPTYILYPISNSFLHYLFPMSSLILHPILYYFFALTPPDVISYPISYIRFFYSSLCYLIPALSPIL